MKGITPSTSSASAHQFTCEAMLISSSPPRMMAISAPSSMIPVPGENNAAIRKTIPPTRSRYAMFGLIKLSIITTPFTLIIIYD